MKQQVWEAAGITVYCIHRGGNGQCVLPTVFVLIWCRELGGAGYLMPPSQVDGSGWRGGWLPEPGLWSRRLESAAGGWRSWSPPVLGEGLAIKVTPARNRKLRPKAKRKPSRDLLHCFFAIF